MKRPVALVRAGLSVLLAISCAQPVMAWGPDGHAIINRLAVASLPSDVPSFLRSPAALDAITYYSSEPDRWRSPAEPELNAAQAPEHFIYLEVADLVGPLPRRRYDYIRALAAAQPQHPDIVMTPEAVGLQPYVTNEVYERLKSAFRDYRALALAHQDTKPSQTEIAFLAGWLGHYVADGAMPLHSTIQYDGWVGPNPNGYTTRKGIHWMFENDFVHANVTARDAAPLISGAKAVPFGDEFDQYLVYLRHSGMFAERLYQLEKAGAFSGAGTPESKAFAARQLASGATELRDMIYTAWVKSGEPTPPPAYAK
jgi:hypothetical protein